MNKTNTTIELLSAYELQSLLMQNARQITTKQKITLKMVKPTMMKAYVTLKVTEPAHMATLATNSMELDEFIADNQLQSINSLDQVQSGTLWLKYLAGKAEVHFEVKDLEATIRFRRIDGLTMVYSPELNFYDDVYQTYSMAPQFEEYLKHNKNRLEKINALR